MVQKSNTRMQREMQKELMVQRFKIEEQKRQQMKIDTPPTIKSLEEPHLGENIGMLPIL